MSINFNSSLGQTNKFLFKKGSGGNKIQFINEVITVPGIGSDDPNNALEPDATAWVLMDGPLYNTPEDPNSGFIGGQSWRKMQPIGYLPYGAETYVYGDEYVRWNGSFWAYGNNSLGDFAISFDAVPYPWLANWNNNYTAAKITSTYVKTTNYPSVP
jgi:hypothetical protein